MPNNFAQLKADIRGWLDRRDVDALIPSWVSMTETDIAEMLRARVMVERARQKIDAFLIELPTNWLAWESIKDTTTGKNLSLEDEFTGPDMNAGGPATAFRMVGNCIEFLPRIATPPSPLPTDYPFQTVDVAYYARPVALQADADTNRVLDLHYSVYLFGACRYGAMFELDDARAAQMETAFAAAIAAANAWKQGSDYSGGPLRAVVRSF